MNNTMDREMAQEIQSLGVADLTPPIFGGPHGATTNYDSGGGPLFTNSVVTGNTLVWHSNGPKPRTVFDWFSTIKYWLHHENMCKDLHPNTGMWLLDRDEFTTWKYATESSVLWLHGIPGCGKSKLVAHVINHMTPLMDSKSGSFAYFYCLRDAAEDERSRPEEVIRSILRQLSFTTTDQKVLKQPAADIYDFQKQNAIQHGSETVERLTFQQSLELLVALLEGSSTVIIIDAIDELQDEERWRLFEVFDEILETVSSGSVRLFVSSRDNGDIKMKLSQYTNVYIRATDNQDDIKNFVEVEVNRAISCHRLLRGSVPSWLKDEILSTLINGAQGMFRWVSLQIQALCSPNMKTTRSVKNALKCLPKTLEDSYDVVYKQILDLDEEARNAVENAVRWLLCAKRPLLSSEFMVALSISKVNEASPLPEEESQNAIEELLDICCNLIVLDESVDTFRMAHLSVREYFERKPGFNKTEINSLALESSIDSLMAYESHNKRFAPFASYAMMYWPEHCQDIGNDEPKGSLSQKMELFLFQGSEASIFFKTWARAVNRGISQWGRMKRAQWRKLHDSATLPPSPLFVASSFGLIWILEEMISRKNFDLNRRIGCEDTALSLAAIWGYKSVAEVLLRSGSDVDGPGNEGRTPLLIAAEHGHQDLVRLFLARGADINSKWATERTPLHEAVFWGQYNIAKILLESGADVRQSDRWGNSPLMTAVQRDGTFIPGVFYDGDTTSGLGKKSNGPGVFFSGDMMALLLEHGANPCSPENKCILLEAIKTCHASAVKNFVERGVDVNFGGGYGEEKPLDYTLQMGLSSAIGVLVTNGAIPGLKWDETSYSIRQWMKEPWYQQLLDALKNSKSTTPAPFIPMPASTESRISREDAIIITQDSPDIPYVWIRIPNNVTSVTCIKFTTESHDQGWSNNAHTLGGTYEQSYTWFEAGFTSSPRRGLARRRIQYNVHASSIYHTHVNVWDADDPDLEIREILATLRPGDAVQVFAKAAFPGWANSVRRVEIEVQGVEAVVGLPYRNSFPKL